MHNHNTTGSGANAAAMKIIMLGKMFPGRVVFGSVAGIRCALSAGLKPLFACVVQPPLTASEKAQVDEWVANDEYQFNVLLVEDEDAPRRLQFQVL